MKKEKSFLQTVCSIAIPVTLQCMLQSSFSMADQIMIGQLGSVSIAGVGLAGKFTSIFNVLVSAIAAVAGIMIAQYMGKKDEKAVDSSFSVNLLVAAVLAVLFTGACTLFPGQIMGIYTTDKGMIQESAGYLRVIAITFLPIVGSTLFATLLRCMEKAVLPLIASILATIVNTGLNYILIFGKWGMPEMGVQGAAIATVIAQLVNLACIFIMFLVHYKKQGKHLSLQLKMGNVHGNC